MDDLLINSSGRRGGIRFPSSRVNTIDEEVVTEGKKIIIRRTITCFRTEQPMPMPPALPPPRAPPAAPAAGPRACESAYDTDTDDHDANDDDDDRPDDDDLKPWWRGDLSDLETTPLRRRSYNSESGSNGNELGIPDFQTLSAEKKELRKKKRGVQLGLWAAGALSAEKKKLRKKKQPKA